MLSFEFLLNALVAGLLLGGFYAALSAGLSLSFGLLDVVNIAHPAFILFGSYLTFYVNEHFGFDPVLAGLIFAVPAYFVGVAVYRIYYNSFEKTGAESLRGLVFFFGLFFLIEVILIITFGVDYRLVRAFYIGKSTSIGAVGIA
ncbi:MAG: branched-chain amino acid ABC transporter permease, partial [Nitrospinae bacterium]|nr:branched-chain amino acid ABC transporter permease [Nitrospinota bacterium]